MGHSPWGHKELDTTERLTVHFSGRSGTENKTKGKDKVNSQVSGAVESRTTEGKD